MSDILRLRPFQRFCMTIGNLPSSYIESLTYAELIYWLCDYLEKKVIPTVNNNSDVVKEIQELFTELQNYVDNYFKNLDVQEEINNKLDEMAESGVLENILMNYVNVTKIYNTTVEMLQDSNLKNNQKVKTLGYYEINDGGGAEFIIKENSNKFYFNTSNNLVAEIIENEELINLKHYGIKNDNEIDNLEIMQRVNDYYTNKTLFIPSGTYLISNTFYISNNNNLLLDQNAEIKANSIMEYLIVYNKINFNTNDTKSHNKFIRGGTLNGDYKVSKAVITLQGYMGFYLEHCNIINFSKAGLQSKIPQTSGNELFCNNCYFWNDREENDSIAINNNAQDAMFTNIIIRDTHYGIETRMGIFTRIHGWIGFKNLLPDSYFIKSLDKETIVSECYADTYQFPFISTFETMIISNTLVLFNIGVYDTSVQELYKPIIYKSELDTYGLNTYGRFKTSNNTISVSNIDVILCDRLGANYFDDNIVGISRCDLSKYQLTNSDVFASASDLDKLTVKGTYSVSSPTNGLPEGAYEWGVLKVDVGSSFSRPLQQNNNFERTSFVMQTYIPNLPNIPFIYVRNHAGGNWNNWRKIQTLAL